MKTVFLSASLLCLAGLLLPDGLMAKENTSLPSVFDQLSGVEVREVELHTNLAFLLNPDLAGDEYQDAELIYEDESGTEIRRSLEVKVRGRYRRRVCDFPPLKLNFSKSELREDGLAGHDKLKLVTHCDDDRQIGQESLLREYLAYELYQMITPSSYRVQLLRIKYVDTGGEHGSVRRYGFIIEDPDELGERLGAEECEDCLNPEMDRVDRAGENLHAMFQYFIGNTDFNLHMARNIKLYQRPDGTMIPVGYDFDFAGLVNAPYAIPSRFLGQETPRDRVFLGCAVDDATLNASISRFSEKREELLEAVRDFRLLSRASRTDIEEYLTSFYDQIELIRLAATDNLYMKFREQSPNAIPAGADPMIYLPGK